MSDVRTSVGQTDLVSRRDGITVKCMVCGRGTHLGAVVETVRVNVRKVTLAACYDCIEVCHVIAVCRMKCGQCGGTGKATP